MSAAHCRLWIVLLHELTHTFVCHLFLFHPSHSNLHICFINSFFPSLAPSLAHSLSLSFCLCMSIFIAHISNQYIKTRPHTNTRAYTSIVSYMLASVISFPIVKWKVNKLPTFLFSYTFFYVYICIFIPNKKNSFSFSVFHLLYLLCDAYNLMLKHRFIESVGLWSA